MLVIDTLRFSFETHKHKSKQKNVDNSKQEN